MDKPLFIAHSDGTIEQMIEYCEDTISRKASIEAMKKLFNQDCEDYGCEIPECFDANRAIKELKALPPVKPITVTEFADRCKECGSRYGRKLLEMESIVDNIRDEIEEYRDSMQCNNESLIKWEAINYILENIIDKYNVKDEDKE